MLHAVSQSLAYFIKPFWGSVAWALGVRQNRTRVNSLKNNGLMLLKLSGKLPRLKR